MKPKSVLLLLLALCACIPLTEKKVVEVSTPAPTKSIAPTSTRIVVSLPPQWTFTPSPTETEILPTATSSKTSTVTVPSTRIPNLAPDFYFTSLDGKTSHLRDLTGTPIALFFAKTTCGFCAAMMPKMAAAHQQYPSILMMLIDSDDDAITTAAFIAANQSTFLGIVDSSKRIAGSYKITAVPTTILINTYGSMVGRISGDVDQKKLNAYLESLLMLSSPQ